MSTFLQIIDLNKKSLKFYTVLGAWKFGTLGLLEQKRVIISMMMRTPIIRAIPANSVVHVFKVGLLQKKRRRRKQAKNM